MVDRAKIMKKEYDVDAGTAKLTFSDGQTIALNLEALTDKVKRQATLHGLLQKIGDAAAGKGGSPDEAYEACMGVFERLTTGEWSKPTEKGEGARPTMVIEAVMTVLTAAGKNPVLADVTARYTGEGAEEKRKAALTNPQVKAAYEKLKADAAVARANKAAEAAAKAAAEPTTTDDL